ncbi:16S rRNA (uracil(1498)-N(3))-methyltransferase [Leucobacter zeae]|nr:16S rRNA (uracil(1498)-N(3))-methyltransferase [Leucobacter zeae]
MANLYYREELPASAFAVGGVVEIAGDEARHAVRVSRLRVGERILVGNGRGALGEGVVEATDKDRFAVRIEQRSDAAAPETRLVLAQALAKGDRDERAVEQATEFGVDAIVPWEASRSVSRWGTEKREKGVAKWARTAREASKQSMRPRIPVIRDLERLSGLCSHAASDGVAVVALHPRGDARLSEWAGGDAARAASEIVIVVGPEGGFADEELDALEAAGARTLVLGDSVLRTSSAGPAGLVVLNTALGRW